MSILLATSRFVLMALVVSVHFLVWGLGLPFVAFSPRGWSRWRSTILRRISGTLLTIMGACIESRGAPPEPPFVLVANHLSYVDILILASRLNTVFVSKHEVAGWPVIGILCRWMGTVFIQRENRRDIARVLEEMHRHLETGAGIVFFPEGTSTNGSELLQFRPSLLEIAVRLGQPVSYASLAYSTFDRDRPAADWVCWWGDRPFVGHFVGLLRLRGFRAELTFGPEPLQQPDRKSLAVELHKAVASQLSLA